MWRDAPSTVIPRSPLPRSDSRWRWLLAAAATAGCGTYLVTRLRSERQSRAARPRTDFDGFLKAKPAHSAVAPQPAQVAKARQPATSFGSFLKDGGGAQPSAQRESTSFASFLKGSKHAADVATDAMDGSGAALASSKTADGKAASGPAPDSVPVTVLYGTEFGFSKEIAEKLRDRLLDGSRFWRALALLMPCADHAELLHKLQISVRLSDRRSPCGSVLHTNHPCHMQLHFHAIAVRAQRSAAYLYDPSQMDSHSCLPHVNVPPARAGRESWTWRTFRMVLTSAVSRRCSAYAPRR